MKPTGQPMSPLVDYADVVRASERLRGRTRHTPLLESQSLNERVGGRILLKAECLQNSGSFKYRGALNALLCLSVGERRRGVIAYSSGNHAVALSMAARELDVPAVVVMPSDAPRPKVQAARLAGGEVIFYNRVNEDREAICADLVKKRGLTLIPPYDHPSVIAGQGTVALEAVRQAWELGLSIDTMFVPCSGGGLAAGCAVALRNSNANAQIVLVEPDGFDDTARSLATGIVHVNTQRSGSICDALLVPTPGRLTFPILRKFEVSGTSAADSDVRSAMRYALSEFKICAEPGGAIALAAAMCDPARTRGRVSLVVVSGGNVELDLLSRVIDRVDNGVALDDV